MWTITCTPPLSERAVKEVTFRNAHICQDPPSSSGLSCCVGCNAVSLLVTSTLGSTWAGPTWNHPLRISAQEQSSPRVGQTSKGIWMANTNATAGHMETRWGGGLSSSWPRVTKSCTGMAFYLCYFIAQNEEIVPPFGRQRCQILQSQRDKRGHQLAVSLGTQGRLVGGQCCARLRLGG